MNELTGLAVTLNSVDGGNGRQSDFVGINRVEDLAADGFIGWLGLVVIGRLVFGQMGLPRIAFGKSTATCRVIARVGSLTRVR